LTEHRDDDLPLALFSEAAKLLDDDAQRPVGHVGDVA